MRFSVVYALILLLLALNCFAAPLQLSGDYGRSILGTIENSTNITNSTNETDLWTWGKLPIGHFINTSSGKLAVIPIADDGMVVVQPRSDA